MVTSWAADFSARLLVIQTLLWDLILWTYLMSKWFKTNNVPQSWISRPTRVLNKERSILLTFKISSIAEEFPHTSDIKLLITSKSSTLMIFWEVPSYYMKWSMKTNRKSSSMIRPVSVDAVLCFLFTWLSTSSIRAGETLMLFTNTVSLNTNGKMLIKKL